MRQAIEHDRPERPDRPHPITEEVRALADLAEGTERSLALEHLLESARRRPSELVPLLPEISRLLDSASGQVREASLQSLALVSSVAPAAMAFLLPRLHGLLSKDSTETVSEQALEILTNYGRSSRNAAERALPLLRDAMGQVRGRAIQPLIAGLTAVAERMPEQRKEIGESIERLQSAIGQNFRNAATAVTKALKREG